MKPISDDEPDEEMIHEFEDNRPDDYDVSSSDSERTNSDSDSQEYTSKEEIVSDDSEVQERESAGEDSDVAAGLVASVDNMQSNIDSVEYDLNDAFYTKYYFEAILSLWHLFAQHKFVDEVNIDEEAFERHNLIEFFKNIRMLPTVTCVSAIVESQFWNFIEISYPVLEMKDQQNTRKFFKE